MTDPTPLARAVARLAQLATQLDGFEIVPGIAVSTPGFQPPWRADELDVYGDPLPDDFRALLLEHGGIEAIDIGGGVGFLRSAQVARSLEGPDAEFASGVREPGDVVPFAVNGGGELLLLARDDSAVYLRSVHMREQGAPRVLASGWLDFLDRLAADWQRFLEGHGAPYLTS